MSRRLLPIIPLKPLVKLVWIIIGKINPQLCKSFRLNLGFSKIRYSCNSLPRGRGRYFGYLEAEGFKDFPLLWHCFGADASLAEYIVKQGWHISIPGTVSFKKNLALREALACIPLNRLHLKPIAPTLPQSLFRGKRNEPAYVVFTAQVIAQNIGMDVKELWLNCGSNAKSLFGL